MHAAVSSSHSPSPAASAKPVRPRSVASPLVELDRLLDRSAAELEALYRDATTPDLDDVQGDLHGRMLAWPMLETRPRVARALRAFAGARSFPWNGKSFAAPRDLGSHGEGINRVVAERARLFRFETFVAKSRAGEFDAVQLDYDLPGNPPVIRSIKDEIRELAPGLWLGQAYLQTPSRDLLWLYFALGRNPVPPVVNNQER